MTGSTAGSSSNAYARFAGFMYLFVTAVDIAGVLVVSRISGTGNFLATSQSIASSETLYRIGLSLGLVGYLATILLAAGLYVAVKPVDANLAMTALVFRVAESAIGGMVVVLGFATLQIYLQANHSTASDANQLGVLADLSSRVTQAPSGVGTVVSAIFFSVGSTIYFYLFFRSAYIPRILAAGGVLASLLCMAAFLGSLVFPRSAGPLLSIGGLPIGLAELATGLWLLIRGIETHPQASQAVGLTSNPSTL